MRILLTANASYAPPKGGSTRSNLLWLAHLARSGHACLVVCPTDGDSPDATSVTPEGIEIRSIRELSRHTHVLQEHIAHFEPDYVLVSSEDVSHVLLRAAFAAAPDRLVYLAHTPQWYPFGPASWHRDGEATEIIRQARSIVAIGHTTANYIREHTGAEASVVHPPVYGQPPWPRFGSFSTGYVLMINPSVVKGISIFLELARRFPDVEFAGLAGWGTTSGDRHAMAELPNVRVLESVANIDEALRNARLLLMPSLWYEGFGLIAMEAMLRGLPVIASDSGGLVEAKQGTEFIIPVRPIERFEARFDETHMPKPVEVPQDAEPWVEALKQILSDEALYNAESERSRSRAIGFVSGVHASQFETLLTNLHHAAPRAARMRVLLAHNSLYYPSHGGGDKSNRLLMEALAERGHEVRVVSRVEAFGEADGQKLLDDLRERDVTATVNDVGVVQFTRNGVAVDVVAFQSGIRPWFTRKLQEFDPDIILTSTDDPGQLLFDLAVRSPRARVVYLIRATIAVPFGPDSSAPNPGRTELIRRADAVVGVSEYVAQYARTYGGLDAVHVPISLLEPGPEPEALARFANAFITMVNPCAVKGISIFLALADRMPHLQFAAVPTWGTSPEDHNALEARPNVTVLPPVDNIDHLLRQTRIMLVPSLWAEARSRIVVEAMERGVPVISSNVGGIPEAHMGVDYMLPVNVIQQYKPTVDMNMVPVAEVPPQNIDPWEQALARLTTDELHWEDISRRSRDAALAYSRNLSVLPFESLLTATLRRSRKTPPSSGLSDVKRKLLALRLRQKMFAQAATGYLDASEELKPGAPLLVCFPWAGSGATWYRRWREPLRDLATPVGIRLPGRESRTGEPPFEDMKALIAALGPALLPSLHGRRFAFFGHSMGSGIAFELTRWLRDRGEELPFALILSATRAPQFRTQSATDTALTDEELIAHLRRLGGIPDDLLSKPAAMELILPTLRADTLLYRRYQPADKAPLAVPIAAWGGVGDPNVTAEHLDGWSVHTTAGFTRRDFPGGHFYLLDEQQAVTAALRHALTQA